MKFECPERRYDHRDRRLKTRHPTLNVEELFGSKVAAKACFRHDKIRAAECDRIRHNRAIAMCNVAERPRMDKRRCPLQCLNQIWKQSISQESCHRTGTAQFLSDQRSARRLTSNQDAAKTMAQIGLIPCKRKYSHYFRGLGNHELS